MDTYKTKPKARSSVFDPFYYLGLILRYRWLLIIPFCIAMVAGTYLAITLPKEYESRTLILVEAQKVPSSYVRPLVSDNIDSRIATMSQQIKSRTNLSKIIDEFDLFSGPKYKKMFLDEKISVLRSRIKVEISRSRRITNAFAISFRWNDPEEAMKVAASLTTYFINQNLKNRESQAVNTRQFLDDELVKMRGRLESVEQDLKNYRGKYMGELPDQLESNLRMLDRLQQNLTSRRQSLREIKNRLALVEVQLRTPPPLAQGDDAEGRAREPSSLDEMRRMLVLLKSRYTEKHPDIVRLENRIAFMESKLQTDGEGVNLTKNDDTLLSAANIPRTVAGKTAQLMLQKQALQQEIVESENVSRNIQARIQYYQTRVENTPKREQQLLSLKRDYDNIQETYNSMLARKLEADIAVTLEKEQKGEQFRIIDPATLPKKPAKPDMRKLFLFAVMAGLAVGAGAIFLLDFTNSGVKQPETFEPVTGVSVLATIPPVQHTRDTVLGRINMVATVFGIMISTGLLACFAAVTIIGSPKVITIITNYTKMLS